MEEIWRRRRRRRRRRQQQQHQQQQQQQEQEQQRRQQQQQQQQQQLPTTTPDNNSWQLCSCIEGLGRSRCFIGKSDDAIGLKRPEQSMLNDSLGYLHAKSLVQSKWMTAAMLCGAFGSTGGMRGRAMWAMFFRRWWQTFFKFFVVDPMSRGTPGRTIWHQLVADQRYFVFVPSCIHLWKWAD